MSIFSAPMLCAYVRPGCTADTYDQFLAIAHRLLQGPGILIGDMNSRHSSWDTTSNRQGNQLHRWAQKNNFLTQYPTSPTCKNNKGSSRIDLAFFRGSSQPSLYVHPFNSFSDHAPVTASISLSQPWEVNNIPLSLIENQKCRYIAQEYYEQKLPTIRMRLQSCSSPAALNILSRHLSSIVISPWCSMQAPTPKRFRPGWTRALDRMAKRRTRLLRSSSPADQNTAQVLDKKIKRLFKRNKKAIMDRMFDELNSSDPSMESSMIKRILKLAQKQDVAPISVDPDSYNSFMGTLQPERETTSIIYPTTFEVPSSFRQLIIQSILTSKRKKAPGPDKIRTEVFSISPGVFADTLMSLWQAVGRLAHVPPLMTSAFLRPIYKSGDRSIPSNYRPIALTTSFRRIITKALTLQLTSSSPLIHQLQWGFQRGSNTECAIAYAANKIRSGHNKVALLDMKKAYDKVPRDILMDMIAKTVSSSMCEQLRPLLYPMRLQTVGQKSKRSLLTLVGMPQGDPPSPILFNIFMNSYLSRLNTHSPSHGIACAFVDDTALFCKVDSQLQVMLNECDEWSKDAKMIWSVSKSLIINSTQPLYLSEEEVPNGIWGKYLGVSLTKYGVGDEMLINRLEKASTILSFIRRVTAQHKSSVRQRRMIVKSFVFSLVDYCLYLQPMSTAVLKLSASFERNCACYILGYTITPAQLNRAMALCRILPIRYRRRIHLVHAVAKFYTAANSENALDNDIRNWSVISHFDTVKPILKKIPISNIKEWKDKNITFVYDNAWKQANRVIRQVPIEKVKELPPVFLSDFPPFLEKRAIQWYFNRIRMDTSQLRNLNGILSQLLQANSLSYGETEELSLTLLQLQSYMDTTQNNHNHTLPE